MTTEEFILESIGKKIAIIIPCYNEELTIGKVIDDFKRVIPEAKIFVCNNNSKDNTENIAKKHGAEVINEFRQGKGYAFRTLIENVDADYYVLVDGDNTYPAESVFDLLEPLLKNEADTTVGDRLSNGTYANENKRHFHNFGNNLVRFLIKAIYGFSYNDCMSGYRAFTKKYLQMLPILSNGFAMETEMCIHTIDKAWRVKEIPIEYRDRPEGSFSKLNTIKDGFKVIMTIMSLFKDYKPLYLFLLISIITFILGIIPFGFVTYEFYKTSFVSKFPTLIVSVGLILASLLSLFSGLILDTIAKNSRKNYYIEKNHYKGE